MANGAQGGSANMTVSTITISEPGGVLPTNIIPQGADIELTLDFETIGPLWKSWAGDAFEVMYYFEGVGATADEVDYGPKKGTLKANPAKYGAPETTHSVKINLDKGVYKVAAMVTLPTIPGIVGFADGLLVQVY